MHSHGYHVAFEFMLLCLYSNTERECHSVICSQLFGGFQKGLFEDIAEGMKNAKIVVACVSDQVNCFAIHGCLYSSLLLLGVYSY